MTNRSGPKPPVPKPTVPKPTVVAVLAGGRSPEHDVSIDSATQVVGALRRERWTVWAVLVDRDGLSWHVRPGPVAADADAVFDREHDDWLTMPAGIAIEELRAECGVEMVFPVFHGPGGEDGTIQGMLTLLGLPFVGSGVAASAIGIDKLRTRELLHAAGVPIAPAYTGPTLLGACNSAAESAAVESAIGFPCFAKVDTSGSSLGVSRVVDRAGMVTFIERHRRFGRRWLAESEVVGEEISVPVLGNYGEELQALTPVGIYPQDDTHFSYEAKYTDGATEEVVPPRGLDPARIAEVQALAVRCHEVLQCDGMSRIDMIVSRDPDRVVVLEVNTIPGLTEASLLPKAATHDGIPFPALLDCLLEAGERRWGLGC